MNPRQEKEVEELYSEDDSSGPIVELHLYR